MSGTSMNMEAAIAAAASKGTPVIRVPEDNELFIDIDCEEDYEIFRDHLNTLDDVVGVLEVEERTSKSGLPHRHIVVRLGRDVRDDVERCLLQAVLGSDRLHELLTWKAIQGGEMISPTLFFEQVAE